MQTPETIIEPLFERVQEYGKTSYELIKLKTVEKTVGFLSSFLSRAIVMATLSIFLLLFSIGISFWVGELLGKVYYGFLLVAAGYLLLAGVLFFFFRNRLKNSFSNRLVTQFLN